MGSTRTTIRLCQAWPARMARVSPIRDIEAGERPPTPANRPPIFQAELAWPCRRMEAQGTITMPLLQATERCNIPMAKEDPSLVMPMLWPRWGLDLLHRTIGLPIFTAARRMRPPRIRPATTRRVRRMATWQVPLLAHTITMRGTLTTTIFTAKVRTTTDMEAHPQSFGMFKHGGTLGSKTRPSSPSKAMQVLLRISRGPSGVPHATLPSASPFRSFC